MAVTKRVVSLAGVVAAGVVASLTLAGCGHQEAKPTASTCGGLYTVVLPSGRDLPVGECAGILQAHSAATVRVSPGQEIRILSAHDADGSVASPPVFVRGQVLAVLQRDDARGTMELRAQQPGETTLLAHTMLCSSSHPGTGPTTCPVLHVRVTPAR